MRTLLFATLLLLPLYGCQREPERASRTRTGYPALDESPPPRCPPAPTVSAGKAEAEAADSMSRAAGPDDFMQRERLQEQQVRSMREYAAQADPDDPFAMSEERIEAFRKEGIPVVF